MNKILILLFFGSFSISYSQWVKVDNLYGGSFTSLASAGNKIYVTEGDGLYVSTDKGERWNKLTIGATKVVAADSIIIIAADCIYRSSNWGATWEKITDGIPQNEYFYTLNMRDSVACVNSYESGVYVSPDFGKSWKQRNNGLPYLHTERFLFDGNVIYKCSSYDIYATTNFGETWDVILVEGDILNLRDIVSFGNKFYCVRAGGIVQVSSDSAKTWKQVGKRIADYSNSIECTSLFINDSIILVSTPYYGIFKSTDNGNTWANNKKGMYDLSSFALHKFYGEIFSANSEDLYKSTDYGTTWQSCSNGIASGTIVNLTNFNDQIYAGFGGIIRKSSDGGSTWSSLHIDESDTTGVRRIRKMNDNSYYAFDSDDDGVLFSAQNENGPWAKVEIPLINYYSVRDVLAMNDTLFIATTSGVFKTSSLNPSVAVPTSRIDNETYIEYLHSYKNSIFAIGLIFGQNVTADNGLHWKNLYPNDNGYFSGQTGGIATIDSFVVMGRRSGGVAILSEKDTILTRTSTGLGNSVVSLCAAGNKIVAGTETSGVFISTDLGKSWSTASAGLPTKKWISSLSFDDTYLFAGVMGKGLWKIPLAEISLNVQPVGAEVKSFYLLQNYPNPFNPQTIIPYRIQHRSHVIVKVHDFLGRQIATLVDGVKETGSYETEWDGSRCSSGIYFYTLITNGNISTKKMALIK